MRALDGTDTDPAASTGRRSDAPRPEADAGAGGRAPRGQGSKLRRLFSRLAADPDELQADELQAEIQASEAMPIGRCQDREQVCLVGTLRTVTFRPHAGVPALEAELWDGTGTVNVIWLGRRHIPGISPGRTIKLRGRITTLRGNRAIYNPIYELRASASD
ncbi:OB-fold nucleic acid binding domain-containing protein [Actinocrinis sp.]|uniref:OB-fold nucleic acid binding domain-containing protein n=1 Tax=Actinocrinis sp. TaxID=1920516 RepID=UPI002D643DAB|nr:OB-fold nucleic acid binding domain-containing protein [Actinocrinis sp.]HZP50999.1 OB-fold nucleic acid binding domain-containing protein [Actinocrinis sp.]